MDGIKLDFDEASDKVATSLYQAPNSHITKKPKCYLDEECEFFICNELSEMYGYKVYECICDLNGKNTMDIFYEDKACPVGKWFSVLAEDLAAVHRERETRESINTNCESLIEKKEKLINEQQKSKKKRRKK